MIAITPSPTPSPMPTLVPVEVELPDELGALSTEPVADAVTADEEVLVALGSTVVTLPLFDTNNPRPC